jgi:hypothetical protein
MDSGTLVVGQLTGNKGPAPGVVADRRGGDRRNRPFRSFLYGNFRPRRRGSRRDMDSHEFIFDWHEPRILYLALGILLLSCMDALITLNLITVGAEEINVVMDAMLDVGVARFLTVKISLTGLSVICLVFAAQRRFLGWFRVFRLLQLVCLGYMVLIGYEIYLLSTMFNFGL